LLEGTYSDNQRDRYARKPSHPWSVPHPKRGDLHWTRLRPDKITKGERIGNARLTANAVKKIRKEHSRGVSQESLAKKYGVSSGTIFYAVHRKTWKHV